MKKVPRAIVAVLDVAESLECALRVRKLSDVPEGSRCRATRLRDRRRDLGPEIPHPTRRGRSPVVPSVALRVFRFMTASPNCVRLSRRVCRTRLRFVRAAHLAAALTASLSILVGLFPASVAGAASTIAFASESGHQIMSAAVKAALSAASCTSSTATKISGQAYSKVTDSTMTTGQQNLLIGGAWTVDRVVGGVVYIKENAAAMLQQFGVSDARAVNRWISIPHTNSNFSLFNAYTLLPSMLSEITPRGTLKTTRTTIIDHRVVVGVTGSPNIHLGLASGTETVYVSVFAPHVPVELVASDVIQGQRQTFVIAYSNWGKRFDITQPRPSLPISSTKLPS